MKERKKESLIRESVHLLGQLNDFSRTQMQCPDLKVGILRKNVANQLIP